jgi:hypothetical protein
MLLVPFPPLSLQSLAPRPRLTPGRDGIGDRILGLLARESVMELAIESIIQLH